MRELTRRQMLASAGAVTLAGCTASGDVDETDEPDPEDYSVTGLEDSDVYHDYEVISRSVLDAIFGSDSMLLLEYDTDAEYDPSEHETYLLDGHTPVSEGDTQWESLAANEPAGIGFDLSSRELAEEPTYRVISRSPVGVVDDFELEISVAPEESSE